MNETQVRALIEQNLQQFAAQGLPRRAGDVDAHWRYRNCLSPEEQKVYDDLLRQGNFAGAAAELLELISET